MQANDRDPVAGTALEYLRAFLKERYEQVCESAPLEASAGSPPADRFALIVTENPAGDDDLSRLSSEGYLLSCSARESGDGSTDYAVRARTSRGLLYGTCRLMASYDQLRAPFKLASSPALPIREWATHTLQGNFNLPLGGSFDRPLGELEAALNRIIDLAPHYGINRLQLDGRAGEGIDIDWFLPYRFLPEVSKRLSFGEPARKKRRDLLRRAAERAHRRGLELLVWDHELVFPSALLDVYPDLRGVEYPVCFSRAFWDDFLTRKFSEFFRLVPEVDGVTLTFAETRGYNLMEHLGCQCEACRSTPMSAKLRRVVQLVDEVCRSYGKQFELRTYNQQPAHAEAMAEAVRGLPRSVTLMTKISLVDFRGVEYPLDPMIGAFPGQPQIVEFTLAPECNGYGYVPAVLARFYGEKMKEIVAKGICGVVGRLDYHLQFSHAHFFTDGPPVLTMDTENGANVHILSRLMWDPSASVEELLSEWARGRYGDAGEKLLPPLLRTCRITQGTFYTLGIHGPSQLDQISDPEFMRQSLADNFLIRYFPGDPEVRARTNALLRPTEDLFRRMMLEKAEAETEAQVALAEVEEAARHLPPELAGPLVGRFRHLLETCRLWRAVAKAFFRWLMWEEGTASRTLLDEALRDLLDEAVRFESVAGPVYPAYNAARGITVYEFLMRVTERSYGAPGARHSDARLLWNAILQACLPAPSAPARALVQLDDATRGIEVTGRTLKVAWLEGETLREIVYPLPLPVETPLTLGAPARVEVTAERKEGAVVLTSSSR